MQGDPLLNRPCAACKILKKKCTKDCPFAPYFGPYDYERFTSVQKVFGVSNLCKMLKEVPENQRMIAVNCIVYEARERLRDPVFGCTATVNALMKQIQSTEAKLRGVRAAISMYENMGAAAANVNDADGIIPEATASTSESTASISLTDDANPMVEDE